MTSQNRTEFQVAEICDTEQGNSDDKHGESACGLQLCFGKRIKIHYLQAFATPAWALIFLSFGHWLDEAVANGLFGVTLASVEKQFQIRPTESGYIGAMMDVGAALTVILSAYYGERLPKPRSIGISIFLAGIGCFVYVTPQFVSTDDIKIEEVSNLCGNVTDLDCYYSPLRSYRFVFMLGMLLCGFGIEYPPTLGISYLDENTSQKRSSLFNGILYGAGGFGPLFGYLLGAAALQMSNPTSEDLSIDKSSATWTGAWWVGFLVVGSGLIISSIPVYLLPEKLAVGQDFTKNREQKIPSENESLERGYWKRLKGLLSNPTYVCISLWVLMYECLIYAIATYAVKVFSVLLGMSESTAGFLLGGIGVGVSVLGYVLGGIIVAKFQLDLRGIVRFVFCCNIISVLFVFGFLLPCSEKEFAGAKSSDGHFVLTSSCNDDCGCTTDYFSPVCDDQGVTYYSPCYAGCDSQENGSVYQNCKCIESTNTTTVSAENCTEKLCENAYAICCVMVVSMFFGYITATPSVQATIRSVRFEERTMALSIQHIFLIIFGRVLGRIMFAKCFDDACLLSSSICGEVGTCRLYEKSTLAMNITILLSSVKFVGVIFAGLALFFIERQRRDLHKSSDDAGGENESAERTGSIPRT